MVKKVTGLRKLVAGLMIPLAVTLSPGLNNGSDLPLDYRKNKAEKFLEESKFKDVSKYDNLPDLVKYRGLEAESCSGYARRVANKNFEKDYFWVDAWNRRYNDKVFRDLGEEPYEQLDSLRDYGLLKPGMILGVFNPKSAHRSKKDQKGKRVNTTHNLIYVGRDKEGNDLYDHQFGSKIERIGYEDMKKYGFIPKEVLDENPIAYAEAQKYSPSDNS